MGCGHFLFSVSVNVCLRAYTCECVGAGSSSLPMMKKRTKLFYFSVTLLNEGVCNECFPQGKVFVRMVRISSLVNSDNPTRRYLGKYVELHGTLHL